MRPGRAYDTIELRQRRSWPGGDAEASAVVVDRVGIAVELVHASLYDVAEVRVRPSDRDGPLDLVLDRLGAAAGVGGVEDDVVEDGVGDPLLKPHPRRGCVEPRNSVATEESAEGDATHSGLEEDSGAAGRLGRGDALGCHPSVPRSAPSMATSLIGIDVQGMALPLQDGACLGAV